MAAPFWAVAPAKAPNRAAAPRRLGRTPEPYWRKIGPNKSPWKEFAPKPEPKPLGPKFPYREPAKLPGKLAAKWFIRNGVRGAFRFIPYFGWAYTAWEVYNFYRDYWHKLPNSGQMDWTGWTHRCTFGTTGVPETAWAAVAGVDTVTCNLGAQVPEYIGKNFPFHILRNTDRTIFSGDVTVFPAPGFPVSNGRYRIKDSWTRDVALGPDPKQVPMSVPWVPFFGVPATAPEMDPLPAPRRIPRRLPRVEPRPARTPARAPYMEPAMQYEQGKPPVIVNHFRARPEPKARERKPKFSKGKFGKFADEVFGGYTEFDDFVNAIWKALPDHARKKPKNIFDKLNQLFEYHRHLDFGAILRGANKEYGEFAKHAVRNYAINQAGDFVIGQANQLANRTTKHQYYRGSRGVGVRRGPELPRITPL